MHNDDDEWGNQGDFDATDRDGLIRQNLAFHRQKNIAEGKYSTPEFRAARSQQARERMKDPEYRARMLAIWAKATQERDHQAIVAKREQNHWYEKNAARQLDPEYRKRHAEAVRRGNPATDPERKEAWRQASMEAWQRQRIGYSVEGREFDSKGLALEFCRKYTGNTTDLSQKQPHIMYPTDRGPGEPTVMKFFVTEHGEFRKLRTMQQQLFEQGHIDKISANTNSWWKNYCAADPGQRYTHHRPTRLADFKL